MIDLTKKYTTKDGRAVEIFSTNCVDCLGQPTVIGCYRNHKGQAMASEWFPSGNFLRSGEFCELDLIEDIPVPVQPERLSLTADEIAAPFNRGLSTDAALFELGFTMQPPAPREIVVDFWVNLYGGEYQGKVHPTKEAAARYAADNRIACINIKRIVKEGDGIK
jgi:hypothetical protein